MIHPVAFGPACCGVQRGSAWGPLCFSTSTDDPAAICIEMTPHWLYCVLFQPSESLLVPLIHSLLNVWLEGLKWAICYYLWEKQNINVYWSRATCCMCRQWVQTWVLISESVIYYWGCKKKKKKTWTLFFSPSSQAPVDGEPADGVVSLGHLVEKARHRLTAAEIKFSSSREFIESCILKG